MTWRGKEESDCLFMNREDDGVLLKDQSAKISKVVFKK